MRPSKTSEANFGMGYRKVDLSKPSTGEEECHALRQTLQSGWLTQGPRVAAFERAFADRHKVEHAVAVSSGTAGLHLALLALGVGPDDEIIVPAFSWLATANAVVYCGATPVFVDIDPLTFNIDQFKVKDSITKRTKAVVCVHLFGLCAPMDILRECVPPGIALIEDAACAAGSELNGRPAGGLGDLAFFSFHPRKLITTGEGGMVTTNDSRMAEKISALRSHGATVSTSAKQIGARPYLMADHDFLGYNYRLSDLQAAVGIVQLEKLDGFINGRATAASWYSRELASVEWLRLPQEPISGRHSWQAFVTYVIPDRAPASRNDIMNFLSARGIETRPGTHAIHMLGYYQKRFHLAPNQYPNARDAYRQSMAIPLHNCMVEEDLDHVVAALKSLH